MIVTSLAAALALLAPAPESLVPSQTPYSAVAPQGAQARTLNDQDTVLFRQGLEQARARDVVGARATAARIGDPVARKLVEWALLDTSAPQLPYSDLAAAQTAFAGWPRGDSRREAAERALDMAYAGPDAALALFAQTPPVTAEGAIALADALDQRGRRDEARALIADWWRNRSFEEPLQTRILGRWSGWLT
ncbi:MAG: lytic transglycosylase domain-containing protein, partial [Pseudomonadota bacterium]|nr:lytic transglycosylase domain-containing protein [Pseudomonadota bacterium]